MDNEKNQPDAELQVTPDHESISEGRRRFAKAGVAGTGVILTLTSRTALGGWGTCTRSEMLSGNMSRQGDYNPCGCSPGYWGNKNGQREWPLLISEGLINGAYAPGADFDTVFGLTGINGMKGMYHPNATLQQVVRKEKNPKNCGSNTNFLKTAAFHAVAALLNASVYGTRFPSVYKSPAAVINAFSLAAQTAYSSSSCNKSALEDFVTAVDVYDSKRTWCFGDQH